MEYGVPLDHAKQTLVKKFGGSPIPSTSERILLVDLQPNQPNVHILCRVITINPKEITVKGETRQIFYGILGDESGTVPFTAWKNFEVEKGDILDISNAYTREWQGETKINFGDRTRIEKTDESRLPDISLEPKEYKIKDLKSGLGAVEIIARVLEINKKEVDVNGEKKNVYSGIIADETGKAQFTSWHDFKLKNDAVFKISGGYVKTWKGIPQLTFDDKATVEDVDDDLIPRKDIKTQKLPLRELVERNGALDVEVEGTVIRIRDGSGIIFRCSECNRVLQGEACTVHGKVKGVADLRIKLDIDDGTGTIGGILKKEITEKLLDKSLEDFKKIKSTSQSDPALKEEIYAALFGHRLCLQGNALGDEFGITLIAKTAKIVDMNIQEESERLLEELEELT